MPKPKKQKKQEQPLDQFTKLSSTDLLTQLTLLKDKTQELKLKRNYIQMDRDMVQQYFKNTENEIFNIKTDIINKETEAETLERNHNVEVKLYLQRVKHLEFEQERSNLEIERDGENAKNKENEYFDKRVELQNNQKQDFKKKYIVKEKKYIDDVSSLESNHKSKEELLRNNYERELLEIENRYGLRLVELKEELDLKLKVEIHEVEERKNLHINELMRNHEEAFRELKGYYNDITSDNLKLISEHKAEIKKMNDAASANKKTIQEMQLSNSAQQGPLDTLRRERDKLLATLKQFSKHKMSLDNYKSKYHVIKEKVLKLEKDSTELNERLEKIDSNKLGVEHKFEVIAEEVKVNANCTNRLLNQKLTAMMDHLDEKEGQLQQIIQQSSLEARVVDEINHKVEEAIRDKNDFIKSLKYSIEHATKAYNDAIRVYEAKLVEFGVPADELGFQTICTGTSTMPAGLVAS